MKKLFLVLLAVLLAFSMAVIGCGGGSSNNDDDDPNNPGGDPPPGSKDMSGEWKIPASFEYDSNYKLDIEWGGPNPTKPDGYQLVIESDKFLTGLHRILKDQEITLTVSFKSDRAADYISFGFIDQNEKASHNNYWGQLTETAVIGKEPSDFNEPNDDGVVFVEFMEDEIAAGIEVGTEYEYEIKFTATHTALSNSKSDNTLVIFIEAPHKKAYTAGAGNVAAAQAEDFITLTFTEFKVEIGSGGTPPPAAVVLTSPVIFNNGVWNTQLADSVEIDGGVIDGTRIKVVLDYDDDEDEYVGVLEIEFDEIVAKNYDSINIEWTTKESNSGIYFTIKLYGDAGCTCIGAWANPGDDASADLDDVPSWAAGWGDAVVNNIACIELNIGSGDDCEEIYITKIWFE